MTTKLCAHCATPFTPKVYRHPRQRKLVESVACSVRCRQSLIANSDGAKRLADSRRGSGSKSPYVKMGGRHEHRAVMEAALGRRLGPNEVVHHKNGNTRDNRLGNLEVLSRKAHALEHDLGSKTGRGSKHLRSKLTEADVLEIRALASSGVLQRIIGARFGINQAHVSQIVLGKVWTHV